MPPLHLPRRRGHIQLPLLGKLLLLLLLHHLLGEDVGRCLCSCDHGPEDA